MHTGTGPWRSCGIVAWPAAALLVLAVGASGLRPAPVVAQTLRSDTLIGVLFADLPPSDGLDANGDGALTVADLLLVDLPPRPTTTPTETPSVTPTPTETSTPTPLGLLFAGTVADLVPHAIGDQLVYR